MADIPVYSQLKVAVAPTDPNHVARLSDVLQLYSEKFKSPCRLASSTNLAGTYDGTYMTLTAGANVALIIDSTAANANDRVLLFGQSTATQNGIYVVTSAGSGGSPWVLTRADDFNASPKIYPGVHVVVASGVVYGDLGFILTTDDPITLDVTPLSWTLSSGSIPGVRQKTFHITGGSGSSPFVFVHGYGTQAVSVEVIRDSDGATVLTGVVRPDGNTVQVSFATNPGSGENYTVLVRAEATGV
jgi:hypothetical protein